MTTFHWLINVPLTKSESPSCFAVHHRPRHRHLHRSFLTLRDVVILDNIRFLHAVLTDTNRKY